MTVVSLLDWFSMAGFRAPRGDQMLSSMPTCRLIFTGVLLPASILAVVFACSLADALSRARRDRAEVVAGGAAGPWLVRRCARPRREARTLGGPDGIPSRPTTPNRRPSTPAPFRSRQRWKS